MKVQVHGIRTSDEDLRAAALRLSTSPSLLVRRVFDEVMRRGMLDEVLREEPESAKIVRRGRNYAKPQNMVRACNVEKPARRALPPTDENYVPRGLIPHFTERRVPPTAIAGSGKVREPELTKTELQSMLRDAAQRTAAMIDAE